MKTNKLYDTDSHLYEFCSTVLTCSSDEGKFLVTLDRTAFFPEGGGQLADTGFIGEAEVSDVQLRGNVIFHTVNVPLEVGRTYDCKLDFVKRFARMQNHSGEHIVSGIIYKHFGYDNVGFHMGHDDVTIDYNGILSESDIRLVEREANNAIYANVAVETGYPSQEELAALSYRSKLDLKENVRIVKIGKYDVCACCAPHVNMTGEIGIIKLLDFSKNKGGTRIHLLCGSDALRDYDERYHMIAQSAQSLSVKQRELGEAIKRLEDEISDKKQAISDLKQELLEYRIAGLKPTDGNLCIFEDELSSTDMRKLMNAGMEICGGICAVFSGNDKAGYTFAAGSKNIKMKTLIKETSDALDGRCGGSDEMIQGSVRVTKEIIKKYYLG